MAVLSKTEVPTTGASPTNGSTTTNRWARWEPLTGIGFVVLFAAGMLTNNGLKDNATNLKWLQYYASSGNQVRLLVSGFLLVLASMCLVVFITSLWSRIAAARRPHATSPLPLVAAGVGAAGIALGGVFSATVPGAMIFGQLRLPSADILRLSSDLSFPAIAVAGMFGVALALAGTAVLAKGAGLFGKRFAIIGVAVGVITLFSFAFVPMVVTLIWFLVVSIMLLRRYGRNVALAA
jgi:hypothetical protein